MRCATPCHELTASMKRHLGVLRVLCGLAWIVHTPQRVVAMAAALATFDAPVAHLRSADKSAPQPRADYPCLAPQAALQRGGAAPPKGGCGNLRAECAAGAFPERGAAAPPNSA